MVSRIYHLDKCLKIYYSINTSIDTDTDFGKAGTYIIKKISSGLQIDFSG